MKRLVIVVSLIAVFLPVRAEAATTLKYVTAAQPLPASTAATATAICPSGYVAIGGGSKTKGDIGELIGGRPQGPVWSSTYRNSSTKPTTIKATAVCAPDTIGVSREVNTGPLAGQQQTAIIVNCPFNTNAVAGAGESNDGLTIATSTLSDGPDIDDDRDDAWTMWFNNPTTTPGTGYAYVLCLPIEIDVNHGFVGGIPAPHLKTYHSTIACGKKEKVLGGGVYLTGTTFVTNVRGLSLRATKSTKPGARAAYSSSQPMTVEMQVICAAGL